MKLKAFAVIDTNVLVSSVISKTGFPYNIMELTNNGNIIPIFDKRMLDEYYKVLHYDKLKKYIKVKIPLKKIIYNTLYNVVSHGLLINNIQIVKELLKDKTDIPFFEVKISSEDLDSYLITGNTKHFPESDTIVSPQVMLGIMRYIDTFLSADKDYDKIIQEIIENKLRANKYTSGTELLSKIFDIKTQTIKSEYFR